MLFSLQKLIAVLDSCARPEKAPILKGVLRHFLCASFKASSKACATLVPPFVKLMAMSWCFSIEDAP